VRMRSDFDATNDLMSGDVDDVKVVAATVGNV
jgi:hypothetical protein